MSCYVPSFLLRLVGRSPEQREANIKFRKSLERHKESEKELDDILGSLQSINVRAKRNVVLNTTVIPPAWKAPGAHG